MAAASAKPVAGARVLIVEDDPAICNLITDLLEELGLEAVCAGTDRDAYALIPRLPKLAALVVDVNLGPGTTGFDVARFARQANPALPVIYVSGEASEHSFRAFGVPDSDFVAKPFTARTLLDTIRARIPAND